MDKSPSEQQQPSIVMQSLLYWEQEKLKALQLDEIRRQNIRCQPLFDFSGCLPRWEKRLRKRLGQVQVLLENVDPEISPGAPDKRAGA
ncbi:MAG TPA: hypothetical protein VFX02_10505 [Gammaproteobacteria bacterium]|nr:hypothetical protein [Gammaproteobacteria bacterium]